MTTTHYTLIAAIVVIVLFYRRRIARLSTHSGFGVLTCEAGRLALRRWRLWPVDVVFADLDYLHAANERWGYDGVNTRVKAALCHRRRDTVAALKQSGDEFFFIVKAGEGAGLAVRLQSELEARGLSATWAVVERTRDAQGALRVAVEVVRERKAARGITR